MEIVPHSSFAATVRTKIGPIESVRPTRPVQKELVPCFQLTLRIPAQVLKLVVVRGGDCGATRVVWRENSNAVR